ncbi:hypothetical protein KATP_03220 [Kluyvera ascorbata]|nr:hypothetical protein KATP_03220 [Kluyvera ascorbata]
MLAMQNAAGATGVGYLLALYRRGHSKDVSLSAVRVTFSRQKRPLRTLLAKTAALATAGRD